MFTIPNELICGADIPGQRWGRRKMMMYAATGQAVSYALITALLRYTEIESYPHKKEVAAASVAFFFTYYIFFGIGFQGVPWLYPTEINSLAMRTKGAAIGTASNWIFNFMGELNITTSPSNKAAG